MAEANTTTRALDDQANALLRKIVGDDDRAAFAQLFELFYAPLCLSALKVVGSPDLAEEAVGDVFVKIWKNRSHLRIEVSLRAYLFRAVRNQSLDYLKKQPARTEAHDDPRLPLADPDASPEALLIHQELQRRIEAAVANLPPQCQQIFRLSREEGLKYQEIAQQLNLSIKTVETQMGRALQKLRRDLAAYRHLF